MAGCYPQWPLLLPSWLWMGPGRTSLGSRPGPCPEVVAVSLTFHKALPATPSPPNQEPWAPTLLQLQKTESKSHAELCSAFMSLSGFLEISCLDYQLQPGLPPSPKGPLPWWVPCSQKRWDQRPVLELGGPLQKAWESCIHPTNVYSCFLCAGYKGTDESEPFRELGEKGLT